MIAPHGLQIWWISKSFKNIQDQVSVLFITGRRVGYAEFGNMHRVHNPTHVCEDPFENDDEQNVVDKCETFVSYRRKLIIPN